MTNASQVQEDIRMAMESSISATQEIKLPIEKSAQLSAHEILSAVNDALNEKGYNPVNQLVGYILSGDPTYITSYNNARSTIFKIERDDLLEELLKHYITTKLSDN
jgi:uncharacterized protein (UPF0297 family)